MGKSIKSECVIQILSRPQKHEQVLKFPTHILSAQSGSVTAHKWFDAAWGPAAAGGVWGAGWIIFSSLQWPWPADWAVPFSPRSVGERGAYQNGPLAPGIHTSHALCVALLSQHSSRQSARWSCELLPPSHLILQTLIPGHWTLPPHKESKATREQIS